MKAKRQQEILNIIAEQDVDTQDQLLTELRARGVQSTQATISRDIKELHLIKELTGYGTYKYAVSGRKTSMNIAGRLRTIFKEGVTSFDRAQNIVVLKTMPGGGMNGTGTRIKRNMVSIHILNEPVSTCSDRSCHVSIIADLLPV